MLETLLLVGGGIVLVAVVAYVGVVIWTILFDESGTA